MPTSRPGDSAIERLDDFGAFYAATYPQAYRTTLAIVGDPVSAADVTQDAYVAAFRARGRYRGKGPAAHWLMRIVVRTAIDALERGRKLRTVTAIGEPERSAAGHEPVVVERIVVERALAGLRPRERVVVVLRYLADLDYAAIAAILDTTPGNVGVILTRSLRHLRLELAPPAATAGIRRPVDG